MGPRPYTRCGVRTRLGPGSSSRRGRSERFDPRGAAGLVCAEKWAALLRPRHDGAMKERRTKRSTERDEAVQHLLLAVALAQGGRGIALVDDRGRLLAGSGSPRQMWAAARVAQGRRGLDGQGFVSRRIASSEGNLTLAILRLTNPWPS